MPPYASPRNSEIFDYDEVFFLSWMAQMTDYAEKIIFEVRETARVKSESSITGYGHVSTCVCFDSLSGHLYLIFTIIYRR